MVVVGVSWPACSVIADSDTTFASGGSSESARRFLTTFFFS